MTVGSNLHTVMRVGSHLKQMHNLRGYTSLYNPLGYHSHTQQIGFVAFIYREVKAISSIDLDVDEARTADHIDLSHQSIENEWYMYLRMFPSRSIVFVGLCFSW